MPLSAGERVGPYEIVAPIGAGGMGEVYQARDTRLGRDVAIKVCTERFSEGFEREAKVIASLNHPNICTAGWKCGSFHRSKRIQLLRRFFRFAMAAEWCEKNPALELEHAKVKATRTQPTPPGWTALAVAAPARLRHRGRRHYYWLVKSDIRPPVLYGLIVTILLVYRIPVWRRSSPRIPAYSRIRLGLTTRQQE